MDGAPYADDEFIARLREYHLAAKRAHREHNQPQLPLPVAPSPRRWSATRSVRGTAYGRTATERQRDRRTEDVIEFGGGSAPGTGRTATARRADLRPADVRQPDGPPTPG